MPRVILHADLNNFYASVECAHQPELKGLPVAVCGDPDLRHGIVLAKNYPAKATGIHTGEAIWQARQKCPNLVVLKPDYPLYLRFSRMTRNIYADYSNQIEPFGLDEAWVDVTGSASLYGGGETIANLIRERIKEELGLTASVGVSYNKIFSKLGSDMKKPDATTVITQENYREKVWPLPAQELLYVGRATQKKLWNIGIRTIGELAVMDVDLLRSLFGKWGDVLHAFANGLDRSPVACLGEEELIKGIGNSTTTPRDLEGDDDAKMIFYVLCESVAARMREHGFRCRTLQIHIRDNELFTFERQAKMPQPTNISAELVASAMELFRANYRWLRPIRSLGVRATDFVPMNGADQLSIFGEEKERLKQERLEAAVDNLRKRFGHFAIQRAVMLGDRPLGRINPKDDHIIHPVGFFKEGVLS